MICARFQKPVSANIGMLSASSSARRSPSRPPRRSDRAQPGSRRAGATRARRGPSARVPGPVRGPARSPPPRSRPGRPVTTAPARESGRPAPRRPCSSPSNGRLRSVGNQPEPKLDRVEREQVGDHVVARALQVVALRVEARLAAGPDRARCVEVDADVPRLRRSPRSSRELAAQPRHVRPHPGSAGIGRRPRPSWQRSSYRYARARRQRTPRRRSRAARPWRSSWTSSRRTPCWTRPGPHRIPVVRGSGQGLELVPERPGGLRHDRPCRRSSTAAGPAGASAALRTHRNNLFTLAAAHGYRLNVREVLTRVCSRRLGAGPPVPTGNGRA